MTGKVYRKWKYPFKVFEHFVLPQRFLNLSLLNDLRFLVNVKLTFLPGEGSSFEFYHLF